ncbi:ABC transporter [Brachybacterium ginsengisoli]|uniref:ABC transporter n=1 Tax=Brachybacterium ginsengisoli TaxID=1331682 RepID=A0A291GTQ8_9MICO|nr:carbohydrate ABC transporter permease [Brachybacterium ginsengisoli]ATG53578.1 ABC transporter [Brachybacterium ginsengisoli]
MRNRIRVNLVSALTPVVFLIVFVVPFLLVLVNAVKDRQEASELNLSLPSSFHLVENLREVFEARDYMLVTAMVNSTVLTMTSVAGMVIVAAMVGFVLQRRRSRINGLVNAAVLMGLIVPPAVVPTIWVLQSIGLFKTLPGLILVEMTFGISFCVLLFRAFMSTVPKTLDEAAIIDGCGPLRLFFQVILPLLKPTVVTVIVVQSVAVFNDFVHPLYFLPGEKNATVQLTLYNFMSQYSTQWNLLFMNILLITIPPLLVFLFFNRQIVAGMTSGAVKG